MSEEFSLPSLAQEQASTPTPESDFVLPSLSDDHISKQVEEEVKKLESLPAWQRYPILAARGAARAVPGSTDVGSALMAGLTYAGAKPPGVKTEGSFGERFKSAREKQENIERAAEVAYPKTTYGSQIAGTIALPFAGPATRVASVVEPVVGSGLARSLGMGTVGGLYGAASGLTSGGDMSERLRQAGIEGGLGAAGGTAIPALVSGVGTAFGKIPTALEKIGIGSPKDIAQRQFISGIESAAQTPGVGMTPLQAVEAARAGQPVMPIDIGGAAIKQAAKTATQVSPEARDILHGALGERAKNQQSRLYDYASSLIGKDLSDPNVTQKIQDAARGVNGPAYKAAMDKGAAGVWSPKLETLINHPWVKKAIPDVLDESNAEAVSHGLPGMKNPFIYDKNGNVSLPVDAQGNKIYPSLAFWDAIKKNISGRVTASTATPMSRGNPNEVRIGTSVTKALTNELDHIIPEYQTARAGAGRYLGEEDAYRFGSKFLSSQKAKDINAGIKAIQNFTGQELEHAQHSYMADRMQKYMKASESRDVSKLYRSPEMKAKDVAILGKQKADELEAFMLREQLMHKSLSSLGGSDTAGNIVALTKNLAQHGAGAATGATLGGIEAYGEEGFNPVHIAKRAIMGAFAGAAVQRAGRLSGKSAVEFANKLVSDDPNVWREAIRAASSHPETMQALRRADATLTSIASRSKEIGDHSNAQEREGRATGGRTNAAMTADKLIMLAESCKKRIQTDTKPLLEKPDESVVHALNVANKHI